ncbi:protein kinase domain-containing protein [Longimicrobium sp.]|uniref:protein kinase domain-containing protein n=1 Tax=Longimicrobium sp. TaxID=2029185 RepID=UPI003B3B3BFE
MAGLESLLKGRELAGRYRIEEVIGRGGMGAVYRAVDQRLGRPVAVKVITASAGNDPEVRERLRARFKHEAASAARLPKHPNAVTVHDYGTDDELGLDFIVMELLEGEDLATRLQRGGMPPMAESLRILQHAARGVAVGHRAGLIHRDVKPGNVFLVRHGDEEEVRVLDFGIAKAMADEDTASAGLTHDGRAPLSPAYASPEQLRGDARLTAASDVFSLGALGFQLLTGTRAFTDADRARMGAGMDVPVPALRARNPQVPDEVEQVIRRALHPDPTQRFADANAMADALAGPMRRITDTPLAAAVPAAGGALVDDDRTMLADADRTAFAGDDDRTMLAPPVPPRGAPRPAAEVRPATPVMTPPRRRVVAEERSGIHPMVWVLLLAVVAIGGFLLFQQMNRRSTAGPIVADTTVVDTAKQDTIDNTDALALSMEGLRFLNAGDPAMALDFFRRANQIDERNPEYRDQMAVALIRLGRHAEAAQLLEATIRIDRRYDLLYSHLAEARLALGDTLAAIRALEAFVETTQNSADSQRAMQMLEALRSPPPPVLPVPGPGQTVDTLTTTVPTDTFQPPPRPAPRDSIRFPR